jgi:hypothetical protein
MVQSAGLTGIARVSARIDATHWPGNDLQREERWTTGEAEGRGRIMDINRSKSTHDRFVGCCLLSIFSNRLSHCLDTAIPVYSTVSHHLIRVGHPVFMHQ